MSELYFVGDRLEVWRGDALEWLRAVPDESVHCCVTSSDYWQQLDHDVSGQVGLLPLEEYIEALCDIFDEIYRVLVPGGCAFQVMADTQNNLSAVRYGTNRRKGGKESWSFRRAILPEFREKQPMDIPFLFSQALVARGWAKRQNMIWDKGSTSAGALGHDAAQVSHEWILYLFKPVYRRVTGKRPYANCRGFDSTVFRHRPVSDLVHICPFPPGLVRDLLSPCVSPGDTVLDPFGGSGATAAVALDMGCRTITGDLKPEYCDRIVERCGFSNPQSGRQVQQTTIFDVLG